jgi:hypothetical protein
MIKLHVLRTYPLIRWPTSGRHRHFIYVLTIATGRKVYKAALSRIPRHYLAADIYLTWSEIELF